MNSRETIVQVSLTSVIQTMVLTLILIFWRTSQKQPGEVIQKCEVLSRPTHSIIVSPPPPPPPPSKMNSPNWMGQISPIPKQIDTLQTSTKPMVTEPYCMKMKSQIRITNVDMNRKMIMQVSQTAVIQTLVLSLILIFWRTL